MKKSILFSVILSLFTIASYAQGNKSQKIAFVNIAKVYDTIPESDSVKIKVSELSAEYEQKLADLEAEIQKLQVQLEKMKKEGKSAGMIELQQRSISEKYSYYQNMQTVANQDIQAVLDNVRTPVLEKIKKVVEQIAKSKGFSAALDISGGGLIWNGNAADDITDLVIAEMTKTVLKPGSAPVTPGAPRPH